MIKTIEAVKCMSCGKVHERNSKTFLSVWGNVNIGIEGGIIGNNIEDGRVERVSIYCIDCFRERINESTVDSTIRLDELLKRKGE